MRHHKNLERLTSTAVVSLKLFSILAVPDSQQNNFCHFLEAIKYDDIETLSRLFVTHKPRNFQAYNDDSESFEAYEAPN